MLGVGADGAGADELGDAVQPGLFHELDAHEGVVVEEAARVGPVGADAAADRGQVDDDVGPGDLEEPADGAAVAEVEVSTAGGEDVGRAVLFQFVAERLAEEASPAGDNDASSLEEAHVSVPECQESGT